MSGTASSEDELYVKHLPLIECVRFWNFDGRRRGAGGERLHGHDGRRPAATGCSWNCGGRQGLQGIAAGGKSCSWGLGRTASGCVVSSERRVSSVRQRPPPAPSPDPLRRQRPSAAKALPPWEPLPNGTIKPRGDRRQRPPEADLEIPRSSRTTSVEIRYSHQEPFVLSCLAQ